MTTTFQITLNQESALNKVHFSERDSIINIESKYLADSQTHQIFYQLPEQPGLTLCKVLVIKNNKVAMFCDVANTF